MANESHKQLSLAGAAASDPTTDIDDDWLAVEDEPKPTAKSILAAKADVEEGSANEQQDLRGVEQGSVDAPERPRPPPLPLELSSPSPSTAPPGSGVERVSEVVARADPERDAADSDEADSDWPSDAAPSPAALKQPVIPRAPRIPGPADLPGPLIPELDLEEIQAALALRRSRE